MTPNTAPRCPKCGTELSWGIPLSDTSGRAKCPSGDYMKHGAALGAYCGWSGTVYRHSNGGVSLTPPKVTPEALTRGRAWFATRPHFHASMRDDVWRCGGTFCGWDPTRRSWLAWSRTHNDRYAQTPAAALALVGYVDPEAAP